MINDTVQARIAPELKKEAEQVFAAIGLKTSDAIRMFLQQCVNVGGLPFRPVAKIPNDATMQAINNAAEGKNLKKHKNIDTMFASWDEEE